MIVYLDTSALVPLLVTEPSTALCRRLWNDADEVASSALAHVEATSALARAHRMGRLSNGQRDRTLTLLDGMWAQVMVVPVDRTNLSEAAAAALRHGLRGYDAVHCAAANLLRDPELVAAAGDRDLLAAWRNDGLAVVDVGAR